MKPLCLLLVGVAIGWAASGVDWSRAAVGQDSAPPAAGAERPVRRGEGVLRRRGLLPPREAASPAPVTDAPAFNPSGDAEAMPDAPPAANAPQQSGIGALQIAEEIAGPVIEPARNTVPATLQVNRYQISAYGDGPNSGAYVIDSATGKVWQVISGMRPVVVTNELP